MNEKQALKTPYLYILDVLALTCLYFAFDGNEYAERLATFWFWLLAVASWLGVLLFSASEEAKQRAIEERETHTLFRKTWARLSVLIEAALMISMGWIVGGFYLVGALLFWTALTDSKKEPKAGLNLSTRKRAG